MAFWFKLLEIESSWGASVPEVRFSGFVHYLCKVVGWQLGKWALGGNSFVCECKYICAKGLWRGNILEKLAGRKFCCAGAGSDLF